MSALYRQWLILKILPTRTKISTNGIRDRLANSYGVSTTLRTVQRDLNALVDDYKFPLICDGEKEAGWSWSKDAPAFGIANMDPVTALTFKLAEKHLTRMMPQGVISALRPYLKAADDRLKATAESSLSRWPEKVRVVSRNLATIPPIVDEEVSEVVFSAVLDELKFHAEYRTVSGRKKTYEVNPLGMAFVDGMTYLVATLNDHQEPLLLLLHRFLYVEKLLKPVVVPDGFDLASYIARELTFPVGGNIKLVLIFYNKSDIQRLEESPLSADQNITYLENGLFELTATVEETRQLHWWLRGFGLRVEVIAPESLRKEFTGMALELAKRYNISP